MELGDVRSLEMWTIVRGAKETGRKLSGSWQAVTTLVVWQKREGGSECKEVLALNGKKKWIRGDHE